MSAKAYALNESLYHKACLTDDELADSKEVETSDLEAEEACGNCNELLAEDDDDDEEDEVTKSSRIAYEDSLDDPHT